MSDGTMGFTEAILIIQLASMVLMAGLAFVAMRKQDAGLVDLGWTFGLGASVLWFAANLDGASLRTWVIAAMVGVWAFRLASYLLVDRILGKEEDRRYRNLREHWGDRADRNFFLLFMAESLLITLFAMPALAAMLRPDPDWTLLDFLGIAVWLVAVLGETAADRQLKAFRSQPENKGKTCRAGFWRYSRHPNYFFEWLHWFAYLLMAVGSSYFWWTLVGPILMYLFLVKITGIPHTERQALASRGDDYRRYQQTTNMFFPWPPKEAP